LSRLGKPTKAKPVAQTVASPWSEVSVLDKGCEEVGDEGSQTSLLQHPPLRPNRRYELAPTWRCVPGNQVCSGRAGGAGCQSKARSTICRIRSNHQRELNGGCPRLARRDGCLRGLPRPSSNCAL